MSARSIPSTFPPEPIETMADWQVVFRTGLCPLWSIRDLRCLEEALEEEEPPLLMGATTNPPSLSATQEWPIEACDFLTLPFVSQNGGFSRHIDGSLNLGACEVGEAEEYFARICFDIDQILGEPAGVRHLINWWDEGRREEVFPLLLAEVRREIKRLLCEMVRLVPEVPDPILADALMDAGIEEGDY